MASAKDVKSRCVSGLKIVFSDYTCALLTHMARHTYRESKDRVETAELVMKAQMPSRKLEVTNTLLLERLPGISNVAGNGLTPLNIALRAGRKTCASFLLSKQWSRIPCSKHRSLSLGVYTKVKHWAENARRNVSSGSPPSAVCFLLQSCWRAEKLADDSGPKLYRIAHFPE